jgi:4-hydroxymandelate oxidase
MRITRRAALISAGVLASGAGLGATPARDLQDADASADRKQPDNHVNEIPPGIRLACLSDYETAARQRIPHIFWEFYNGSAADELTMRWNIEAYQRMRLRPRVLVDVSSLDTRVTLFGHQHAFPILLAPTAYQRLAHPDGEIATARGANTAGATMVLSTSSTTAVEDIARTVKNPLWFQLYVQRDRGFTRELVQRAEAAGCEALCLTVDTPVAGVRNREDRVDFRLPPGFELPNLRGLKVNGVEVSNSGTGHLPMGNSIYNAITDPSLAWKDVEWLTSFVKIPLLLKGVLNPDDADHALKSGASGLIVSNHGARNLDTVPPTIEVLPLIAEKVSGRVPLLVDGGVRRGTDVLKALAWGASAVLIGRPYVYGLAVAGEDGVARVVDILQREFKMAMALTGRPTIGSIDSSVIWPRRFESSI